MVKRKTPAPKKRKPAAIEKLQPSEALAWVERGLQLGAEKDWVHGSSHELPDMKRELLRKLGRGEDALEAAWKEFQAYPSEDSYTLLPRFPRSARRLDPIALPASKRRRTTRKAPALETHFWGPEPPQVGPNEAALRSVVVRRISRREIPRWREAMRRFHYLGDGVIAASIRFRTSGRMRRPMNDSSLSFERKTSSSKASRSPSRASLAR